MTNIHFLSRLASVALAFFCVVSVTPSSCRGMVNHSADDEHKTRTSFSTLSVPTTTSVGVSWYVSTTGSDSSDGRTVDTPFRMIGTAVSLAQPGDIIFVRGGVYNEYIRMANNGTTSSPITLSGYPGETAIVDGSHIAPDPNQTPGGYNIPPLLDVRGNYVTIQDLEIRHAAGLGVLVDATHHVMLDNLHVHHSYLTNVNFWRSQDSTIQNSTLHDAYDKDLVDNYSGGNADGIGANGFSQRITIRNNECYHNSDDGIDVGDSTYTLVEGNHCHHNGFDQGDAEGCKVLNGTNNTFRNNVAHDQRIGFDSGTAGGNFFYNNTAYNNYEIDYIEYYGNTSVNTGNSWN